MRIGLYWTTALIAGGIAFAPAEAGVREGVEAWQRGEYDRAVAEWEPLAERGDADAQFNLGQAYKLGRGVPQDMERAEQLYGDAARQGHLQAQANYGLILFQNGDREEAMPHIIEAANRGEPRAQYIYGTALFNGDLVERDWVRGYAMMTRAAVAGLPQAQTSRTQMEQHLTAEQRRDGTELARSIDSAEMAEAPPPPPPPSRRADPP
ncbi:MAG: sel1 repeat family protein, partial [Sphingomonadaceae bacterium]|nr:sel1 repeat family protein [Sphingomonadaceae bacterium]